MDSDFEIFSLKDSVWKLNTRVLVLESFITQRFGSNVLRDAVTNDPVSGSNSTPSRSSTLSWAQKSSWENKTQPQEASSSSMIAKDLKKLSTENQNHPNKKKKRTKRVNSEESSEEESDTGNGKNDKSRRLRRTRTSTKKVKCNEEDISNEYYVNNEDGVPEYIALLEPKTEMTDEVQNDTDMYHEMRDAEIEDNNISSQPSKSVLTQNEETDDGPAAFTLEKSRRGKDQLVDLNQNIYRFHKFGADKNKLMWMCIRNDCKGRVHTIGKKLIPVAPHSTLHTTENIQDIKIREFKLKLKEGADVTLKPSEIVATALQSEESIAVKARLPKLESLKAQIRRERRRKSKAAANPVTLIDLALPL